LEKLADAHRQRVVLEAEAEAEAIRLNGEAQAFAIEAKAKAEAEQMSKKAAAFKEYREAAMVDMLLQTLPKVRLMERGYCISIFVLSFSNRTKTQDVKQVNVRLNCSDWLRQLERQVQSLWSTDALLLR